MIVDRRARHARGDNISLWIRRRTGQLAVALSGGGHRATLFALGALLALVDRGLNRQVAQISSVSGGSIANAFVAQRCHFDQLGPGELDPVAAELVGDDRHPWRADRALDRRHRRRGDRRRRRRRARCCGLSACRRCSIPFVGLIVASACCCRTGLLVQRLLDRRYFRRDGRSGHARLARRSHRRARLLLDRPRARPAGVLLVVGRRLVVAATGPNERATRSVLRYGADNLSLAEVVRASSAFPGIPPLRLRVDAKLRRAGDRGRAGQPGRTPPGVLFLADGGLWNNLGSHVLREDGILRGEEGAGRGMPLLCVNSSAAGAASAPATYSIPVVAQFAALFRTLRVLTVNTVQPRVDAITEAMARRNASGTRPGPLDPLDVVVDLTSVRRHEASIRLTVPGSRRARRPIRSTTLRPVVVERLGAGPTSVGATVGGRQRPPRRHRARTRSRPSRRAPADDVGVLDLEVVENLVAERWWTTLRSNTGPETLSRAHDARPGRPRRRRRSWCCAATPTPGSARSSSMPRRRRGTAAPGGRHRRAGPPHGRPSRRSSGRFGVIRR